MAPKKEKEVHVHLHITSEADEATHNKIDQILNAVLTTKAEVTQMAGELDTLESDVTAQTDVIQSAVTLLSGLKAALDAAIASGDMSRVAAVNAQIESQTQALSAAVAANTPAA